MTETRLQDLVEIYAAATAVEADRIVLLLDEEGVDSVARATTMSSFPSPVEAHYLVCVASEQRTRAREIIAAARRDSAISEDGAFL